MQRTSRTSRRTFLKGAGAATLAAGIGPQILPSGAFGAAGDKLNIALLGCGSRMGQILPSILRPGDNVVALCEVNPRNLVRLREIAAKENRADMFEKAKVYEDYRQLLEAEKSVDAVVIASGQRWHVPMSAAALKAGKHVFCEKPMSHSCVEARQIRDMGRQTKLATQLGTQGGTTDTFRRAMEIIQAGVLGQIKETHAWINRTFPPSAPIDTNADPLPDGLNWDAWCGPSQVLPFKRYYLPGCLAWGRWLEFGDGHLADMGAHGLNLPWRALKLGTVQKASVKIAEPLKDSYPSACDFRWDFAAREGFPACTLYWHDGPKAGAPEEYNKDFLTTYERVPTNGVLFIGGNGLLKSDAWGVGGVMKLKGDAKFRGVNDHEAAKALPVTLPRQKGQNHMEEWLDACKGKTRTFQGFDSSAMVAEIAMVGMVAMRMGRTIEWDSENLKAKGCPEADKFINLPVRKKWL